MPSLDELRFETLKEDRGWYLVEYYPPFARNPFAVIQVLVLEDQSAKDVARVCQVMEEELTHWMTRYPVPAMVSSFSPNGDLLGLSGFKSSDHLIGYFDGGAIVERVWGKVSEAKLLEFSSESLRDIYSDIPCRTVFEIRSQAVEKAKKRRVEVGVGFVILVFWLVVIPVIVAVLGFASPVLGWIAFLYSLWKAFVQLMRLMGKWPVTKAEKARVEEERLIRHYYWHCNQNPEGFQRLKMENLERLARRKI
ncbi:MAG: hypothetical protein BGO12_17745 [Verrucomicrobia bacterium 61-8]|nr:MAG: hypothetical protein BGO12_17745 [Verrucomicrobia bacterium 61-8]